MTSLMAEAEIQSTQRLTLHDAHRRHIAVALRHAAELLDVGEQILMLNG
jgi:hypothetical protein